MTGRLHLGNLGLGHPAQARKQLQVFPASEQFEDGIRLRTVAHAAVCGSWLLGHTGGGDKEWLMSLQATHAGFHG